MVLHRHNQKSPCIDLGPPTGVAPSRRPITFKRLWTSSPSSGPYDAVRSSTAVRSTSAVRSTPVPGRIVAVEKSQGPDRQSPRWLSGREGGREGGQVHQQCDWAAWWEVGPRRRAPTPAWSWALARTAPAAVRSSVWRPTLQSGAISPILVDL